MAHHSGSGNRQGQWRPNGYQGLPGLGYHDGYGNFKDNQDQDASDGSEGG